MERNRGLTRPLTRAVIAVSCLSTLIPTTQAYYFGSIGYRTTKQQLEAANFNAPWRGVGTEATCFPLVAEQGRTTAFGIINGAPPPRYSQLPNYAAPHNLAAYRFFPSTDCQPSGDLVEGTQALIMTFQQAGRTGAEFRGVQVFDPTKHPQINLANYNSYRELEFGGEEELMLPLMGGAYDQWADLGPARVIVVEYAKGMFGGLEWIPRIMRGLEVLDNRAIGTSLQQGEVEPARNQMRNRLREIWKALGGMEQWSQLQLETRPQGQGQQGQAGGGGTQQQQQQRQPQQTGMNFLGGYGLQPQQEVPTFGGQNRPPTQSYTGFNPEDVRNYPGLQSLIQEYNQGNYPSNRGSGGNSGGTGVSTGGTGGYTSGLTGFPSRSQIDTESGPATLERLRKLQENLADSGGGFLNIAPRPDYGNVNQQQQQQGGQPRQRTAGPFQIFQDSSISNPGGQQFLQNPYDPRSRLEQSQSGFPQLARAPQQRSQPLTEEQRRFEEFKRMIDSDDQPGRYEFEDFLDKFVPRPEVQQLWDSLMGPGSNEARNQNQNQNQGRTGNNQNQGGTGALQSMFPQTASSVSQQNQNVPQSTGAQTGNTEVRAQNQPQGAQGQGSQIESEEPQQQAESTASQIEPQQAQGQQSNNVANQAEPKQQEQQGGNMASQIEAQEPQQQAENTSAQNQPPADQPQSREAQRNQAAVVPQYTQQQRAIPGLFDGVDLNNAAEVEARLEQIFNSPGGPGDDTSSLFSGTSALDRQASFLSSNSAANRDLFGARGSNNANANAPSTGAQQNQAQAGTGQTGSQLQGGVNPPQLNSQSPNRSGGDQGAQQRAPNYTGLNVNVPQPVNDPQRGQAMEISPAEPYSAEREAARREADREAAQKVADARTRARAEALRQGNPVYLQSNLSPLRPDEAFTSNLDTPDEGFAWEYYRNQREDGPQTDALQQYFAQQEIQPERTQPYASQPWLENENVANAFGSTQLPAQYDVTGATVPTGQYPASPPRVTTDSRQGPVERAALESILRSANPQWTGQEAGSATIPRSGPNELPLRAPSSFVEAEERYPQFGQGEYAPNSGTMKIESPLQANSDQYNLDPSDLNPPEQQFARPASPRSARRLSSIIARWISSSNPLYTQIPLVRGLIGELGNQMDDQTLIEHWPAATIVFDLDDFDQNGAPFLGQLGKEFLEKYNPNRIPKPDPEEARRISNNVYQTEISPVAQERAAVWAETVYQSYLERNDQLRMRLKAEDQEAIDWFKTEEAPVELLREDVANKAAELGRLLERVNEAKRPGPGQLSTGGVYKRQKAHDAYELIYNAAVEELGAAEAALMNPRLIVSQIIARNDERWEADRREMINIKKDLENKNKNPFWKESVARKMIWDKLLSLSIYPELRNAYLRADQYT